MDAVIRQSPPLRGTFAVPPDKAICHRAVLLAAIGTGETTIQPWPAADDCRRSLELAQRLGVPVARSPGAVTIRGVGMEGLRPPFEPLDCGDSGTTLRLAAGLLAGQPFTSRLSAGPSLSRRPMRRIAEPLTRMGARIEGASSPTASDECHPPLTVQGRRPLAAIRYEMPVASAQVKSAILLAGLCADGRTTILEAQPTRDHTERLLRHCGIRVRRDEPGGALSIEPGTVTSPGLLTLPGDFSSAAFFLVAGACVPGSKVTLTDVGLNPTRAALLGILRRMGAQVSSVVTNEGWEPRGTIVAEARALHAVTLEPHEVPGVIDELPILMVAAASATGATRFRGVGELRAKETDRIHSMVSGLGRLGIVVRVTDANTVEVEGGRLLGARVESAGDHRTAMSLAIAGLVAEGTTTVRGAECVAKSFPEFFDQLRLLAGSSTVKTVDKV